MKKKMATVIMAMVFSLGMATVALAGEWKQDGNGWWYANDDGSYPAGQWQEIAGVYYYFGADGYMLANTTTPDGYQVGADGAWIENPAASRPVVPYYQLLSDPEYYNGGYGEFFILWGKRSDLKDCGNYYELGNQELYKYRVYDTEKAAKKSSYYKNGNCGTGVGRLPNGKYIVHDDLYDYETVTAYAGPIYLDKNVVVKYSIYDYYKHESQNYTCTLDEYFALSGSIENTMMGEILGCAKKIDANGYVTVIQLIQGG